MTLTLALSPFQLHLTLLAVTALIGAVSVRWSLKHPGLLGAIMMFGGPLVRPIIATIFSGLIILGIQNSFVSILSYATAFCFSQLLAYFIDTLGGGLQLSKRAKKEMKLLAITSLLLVPLMVFAPFSNAFLLKAAAAVFVFTYFKLAGMVATDLSHIDDTSNWADSDK